MSGSLRADDVGLNQWPSDPKPKFIDIDCIGFARNVTPLQNMPSVELYFPIILLLIWNNLIQNLLYLFLFFV